MHFCLRNVSTVLTALGLAGVVSCSHPTATSHVVPPTFTHRKELEVPLSSVIVADRTASSGFRSPYTAAESFIRILFSRRYPALIHNQEIARKYFSASLRHQVALSIKQAATWKQGRGDFRAHPGIRDELNKGVFEAWDIPTGYSMASSHVTGLNAVVDVIYKWAPGTQYSGDTRVTSVMLVKESGRWFINDLYTHEGNFCSASSFNSGLVW